MPACPDCRAENDLNATRCVRCGANLLVAPTAVVVTVDLSPGTLFASRYQIERQLGRGGMGMVYLARDRTLDEVVAIKVLRPDFAQDPGMAARFKSEIKLARKIRHRNVGTIHDFGEERGLLYISMEFIEGVDLKQLLRKNGPFREEEAYALSIEVAEGLQAVHDAGIVHRDLKTPNIMRDEGGHARLMDFGIAKQVGAETATATGAIVGTPEYMSPEQAQGKKVDFRSDLYALGIVVHEIFSGSVPFRADTPIATILKQIQEPPTLEGPGAPILPKPLIPVLRRCLAKDPAERYTTARDVADALRRAQMPALRQQPVGTEVLQAPTLKRMAPPSGRSSPILAIAGVVAVAAGGLAWWALRPAPAPETPVPTPLVAAVASPTAVTAAPTATVATAEPTTPATPTPTLQKTLPPMAVVPPAGDRPAPRPPARAVAAAATVVPTSIPRSEPATTAPAAASAAQREGFLLPVSKPFWSNVIVGSVNYGTPPRDRIPLAPGEYVVRFERYGYRPIEKKVTIRPGQIEKVVADYDTEGTRE